MTLERCRDDDEWDRFVEESPQGSVFSYSAFLRILSDVIGLECERWIRRDTRLNVAALLVTSPDGQIAYAPHPFSLYQGMMLDPRSESLDPHSRIKGRLDAISDLLSGLVQHYPRLSFCLAPEFPDLRPFSWLHFDTPERGTFDISVRYTGRIDLGETSGFDEYVASVRKSRRYEYHRARKEGHSAGPSVEVGVLRHLYERTFERQGLEVDERNLAFVSALAEGVVAGDVTGELIVGRSPEGDPTAATLFLFDQKRVGYYLIAANDPNHRNHGSGTLVVMEAIRRCFERGIRVVDVCGMNSPNRGDFKASLNAQLTPYYVASWDPPAKGS